MNMYFTYSYCTYVVFRFRFRESLLSRLCPFELGRYTINRSRHIICGGVYDLKLRVEINVKYLCGHYEI